MVLTAENSACDLQRIGLEQTELDWKMLHCNISLKVLICVTVWVHKGETSLLNIVFFLCEKPWNTS